MNKEAFYLIIESTELMSDKDFINSYKKSRKQIRKKDFVNWDEL